MACACAGSARTKPARRRARTKCSSSLASRAIATAWYPRCPSASRSWSSWAGRSSRTPGCCCSTSRAPALTTARAWGSAIGSTYWTSADVSPRERRRKSAVTPWSSRPTSANLSSRSPMPSAARPLLTVNEIEAYYGRVCALDSVSLEVAEGSVVALLGANGAGKTTTLRVISGLVRPTRGSVLLDGRRIDGWSPDRMVRAGIVQVPEGRQIFADLTVRENLLLGGYARRDLGAARQEASRVFEYFPRLRERLHQRAGTLSGGEQQMLAIGRALMARPRLLVLDEPSLGLAPMLVKEIFLVIREIRAAGATVLLVEQNAHMALEITDHAYVLETGRVILGDRSAALRQREEVRRAYLGH